MLNLQEDFVPKSTFSVRRSNIGINPYLVQGREALHLNYKSLADFICFAAAAFLVHSLDWQVQIERADTSQSGLLSEADFSSDPIKYKDESTQSRT